MLGLHLNVASVLFCSLFVTPHICALDIKAVNMSAVPESKPTTAPESVEPAPPAYAGDHEARIDEKGAFNKSGAIEAENAEHNMGVLQAVREYPMAAWWAFVMSCTIVSHRSCDDIRRRAQLTQCS